MRWRYRGGVCLADNLNRQHRDTLFRLLFKEPEHFLHLLRHCRGADAELVPDDIQPFDLDSPIVSRMRRNDVSFITKDNRLIILVEHQSTINPNMAFRLLLYYLDLVHLWINQNGIDVYSNKKILALPAPEFYVAYNGSATLQEDCSTFRLSYTGIEINVVVKIIDIRFNKLPSTASKDTLAGYSYFYSVYDQSILNGMTSQKAFEAARDQCVKSGYLLGVVDKEDFIMFYRDFMNYDAQVRSEERAAGESRGVENAIRVAIKSGVPHSFVYTMAKGLNVPDERVDELIVEVLGVGAV